MVNGTAVGERNDGLASRIQVFLKQLQMGLEFGQAHVGSHTKHKDEIETMPWHLNFSQCPNPAIGQWDVASLQHGRRNIGGSVFKRLEMSFEVIVQGTAACPDIENGFALKIQPPDCFFQSLIEEVGMIDSPGGVTAGIVSGNPVKIQPDL